MPFSLHKKSKRKSQNDRTPNKKITQNPVPSPTNIPDFLKSTTKTIPLSRKMNIRKEQICINYDSSVNTDDTTMDATPKSLKRTLLESNKSKEPAVKKMKFSLDNNVQIVYKNLKRLKNIYDESLSMNDPTQKEKYLKDNIADIFKKSRKEISKENILTNINYSELTITPVKRSEKNLERTNNETVAEPVNEVVKTQNSSNQSTTPIKNKTSVEYIDLTDSETPMDLCEDIPVSINPKPTPCSQKDVSSNELPREVTNPILNSEDIPIKTSPLKSPQKNDDSPYSDVLLYCINKSRIYSPSIFDEYANKICSQYKTLQTQERVLYQNLLCRKWDWIKRDDIIYSDISNIPEALESLMINGFIQPNDPNCNFDDILWSMNVNKLNDLSTTKDKKEELIKNLRKVANALGVQFTANSQSVEEKISKAVEVKKSIKLTKSVRDLFLKMLVSTTCPFYKGKEDSRLPSLQIKFQELESEETKLYPLNILADKLFLNTNTFEKYFKSIDLQNLLQDAKLKKNWSRACDLCETIKDEFDSFMWSEYNFTLLNDHSEFFHRKKFMAGSTLAYCLSSSIDVLKREKRYTFAIRCLDGLLNQNHFVQRRRAKWYEHKLLIYERYLKENSEVIYQLLIKALQDDNLTHLGKRIISKKAEPYVQIKARKISNDKKEILQKLMIYKTSFIETTHFSCKSMPNVTTSKKQLFIQDVDDGQIFSTVEELAIGYYKEEYPICIPDEGSSLKKLTLGLFFSVIYENIEGMFVSELQDLPLDWGGERFFKAREDKFEAYKETLMQGGEDKVEDELYSNQTKIDNTLQNELINLRRHDIPNLIALLKCMTLEKFMKFAFYLLQNFSERKSGLPDLTMFNIHNKTCAFIEVNGPREKPSQNQILWMEKLQEFGLQTGIFKVSCAIAPKPKPVQLIDETQTN